MLRDTTQWMKDIPDNELICDINLPGTHNSGAVEKHKLDFWSNQYVSITTQLHGGVRFLDIRLKVNRGDGVYTFTLCHGENVIKNENEFESLASALNRCKDFLTGFPSETIVMLLKIDDWNGHKKDPVNVCKNLKDTFNILGIVYNNSDTTSMPTLGNLRGKIFLLCRIPEADMLGTPISWADNTPGTDITGPIKGYVQDHYKGFNTSIAEQQKSFLFSQTLNQKTDGKLLINFASAVIDVDESTFFTNFKDYYHIYINEWFVNFLGYWPSSTRPTKLGWCLFDDIFKSYQFPKANGVINCASIIIDSNFQYATYPSAYKAICEYDVSVFNMRGCKTASPPFLDGEYLYFQGPDSRLCKLKTDGTGLQVLKNYQIFSSPFVVDGYIYFQGPQSRLFKTDLNGEILSILGSPTDLINSSPFVAEGYIYFRGMDNKLYQIETDGTKAISLGNTQIQSRPAVADNYVYFQGIDNKLYQMKTNGSALKILSDVLIRFAPVVEGDYVYFQEKDSPKFFKIKTDGSSQECVGEFDLQSIPFITSSNIYFQGPSNRLYQVRDDSPKPVDIGGRQNLIVSSPVGDAANNIYFQGWDAGLWKLVQDYIEPEAALTFTSPTIDTLNPLEDGSNYIYFSGIDHKLYQMRSDGTMLKSVGNAGIFSSPAIGRNNWAYYRGTDNKLYAISTATSDTKEQCIQDAEVYSTPFVYQEPNVEGGGKEHIYFQGANCQLFKLTLSDSRCPKPLKNYQIFSSPFVVDGYIYFQGPQSRLFKTDLNGDELTPIKNYQIFSSPYVVDGYIYFQGPDNLLFKTDLNGEGLTPIKNYQIFSSPCVVDGYIYFQGEDNGLCKIKSDGSGELQWIGGFRIFSSPCVTKKGVIFCQAAGDFRLLRITPNVPFAIQRLDIMYHEK